MTESQRLTFSGNSDRPPQNAHPDSPAQPEPYVMADPLKKAVNLAIYLRRPLLLEGDAGCGKTRLASAVAYELGLPLYRWDIRSSTKAQDGLYEYDAILRLHDVEVQRTQSAPSVRRKTSRISKMRLPCLNSGIPATPSTIASLDRWEKPLECAIAPLWC